MKQEKRDIPFVLKKLEEVLKDSYDRVKKQQKKNSFIKSNINLRKIMPKNKKLLNSLYINSISIVDAINVMNKLTNNRPISSNAMLSMLILLLNKLEKEKLIITKK